MRGNALILLLTFAGAAHASTPPAAALTPSSPAAVATAPPEGALAPPPLRLALLSTSAFGVTHARFFNQLVGARVEYGFTPRFALDATMSYVNLKGKDGRVHNVLPEAGLAYRLPLHEPSVGIPLRYGLGFLPKNGPTLRLGAGLSLALGAGMTLELVPLETLVWITRERPEVSLNASVALSAAW